MLESAVNYLFVYGTLMQDVENEMSQFLKKHSTFVGKGNFQGSLYEVAGYPGAILSENETYKVYGDLFIIQDAEYVFSILDPYEGIEESTIETDLYKREVVDVILESGVLVKAWVYLYNLEVTNLRLIPSGYYLKK
ncbi:gamma-glutamylcyclotransferase family protein [Gaetbulibacter saemankumensis]|uniref:gamma-glutamylcyclotransferase family protein n=1 Tax=Gaetbulibacter saemankumensis TaxID=311208 RepID=UPI000400C723|nr:gamma-glutamylcyclotransferase family protein [Gaetbulibacter saemankumensis]